MDVDSNAEPLDQPAEDESRSIEIMSWRCPISNQSVYVRSGIEQISFSFLFSSCIVCGLRDVPFCRLSPQQRHWIFLIRGIFVPKGCRCCVAHLHQGQLSFDAINTVRREAMMELKFTALEVRRDLARVFE
jgi:hypothetical protein